MSVNIRVITLRTPCSSCLIKLPYIKETVREVTRSLVGEGYDVHYNLIEITSKDQLRSVMGLKIAVLPAVIVEDQQVGAGEIVDEARLYQTVVERLADSAAHRQ